MAFNWKNEQKKTRLQMQIDIKQLEKVGKGESVISAKLNLMKLERKMK